MAIYKYVSSGTPGPSEFVTWFNTNKTGTVLENVTASYTQTSSSIPEYKTTFTDGTNTLTIETAGESNSKVYGSTTYSVIAFNGTSLVNARFERANSSYYLRRNLRTSLLCKNGLIIGYGSRAGNNTTTHQNKESYHTPVLLTVDNNGNLTAIGPYTSDLCGYLTSGYTDRGTYVSVEINGYKMFPSSSPTASSGRVLGISSNYATSLQHFTSYDQSGNGYYTPFAYYSIVEQFTPDDQSTVGTVMLDNKKYITNGRWYIQDDD